MPNYNLPDYLFRHASAVIDSYGTTLTKVHMSNMRPHLIQYMDHITRPHMEHYYALPAYMQLKPQTRFEFTIRLDKDTKVDLGTFVLAPYPCAIEHGGNPCVKIRAGACPQEILANLLPLVVLLEQDRRKIDYLHKAIRKLAATANTPAQACWLWPDFRTLLADKGKTSYALSAQSIPHHARPTPHMRNTITNEETSMWSVIYHDVSLRASLLSKET